MRTSFQTSSGLSHREPTCPGDMPCMLPLSLRRAPVVNDAPRPSAASAADSVGVPFLSWLLWCIQLVSLPMHAFPEYVDFRQALSQRDCAAFELGAKHTWPAGPSIW